MDGSHRHSPETSLLFAVGEGGEADCGSVEWIVLVLADAEIIGWTLRSSKEPSSGPSRLRGRQMS